MQMSTRKQRSPTRDFPLSLLLPDCTTTHSSHALPEHKAASFTEGVVTLHRVTVSRATDRTRHFAARRFTARLHITAFRSGTVHSAYLLTRLETSFRLVHCIIVKHVVDVILNIAKQMNIYYAQYYDGDQKLPVEGKTQIILKLETGCIHFKK